MCCFIDEINLGRLALMRARGSALHSALLSQRYPNSGSPVSEAIVMRRPLVIEGRRITFLVDGTDEGLEERKLLIVQGQALNM